MNESTGNALIFYGIIIFTCLFIAFFIGSISYSKAYKVKNRIIEEIEKEGESLLDNGGEPCGNAYNDEVEEKIKVWLEGNAESTGNAVASANSWGDIGRSNQNTTINSTGIGYQKNNNFGFDLTERCNEFTEDGANLVNNTGDYVYCVFIHYNNKDKSSCYYKVVTFMSFNVAASFGLKGLSMSFPVKGETMTFKTLKY